MHNKSFYCFIEYCEFILLDPLYDELLILHTSAVKFIIGKNSWGLYLTAVFNIFYKLIIKLFRWEKIIKFLAIKLIQTVRISSKICKKIFPLVCKI
jgi:hypothetical protein